MQLFSCKGKCIKIKKKSENRCTHPFNHYYIYVLWQWVMSLMLNLSFNCRTKLYFQPILIFTLSFFFFSLLFFSFSLPIQFMWITWISLCCAYLAFKIEEYNISIDQFVHVLTPDLRQYVGNLVLENEVGCTGHFPTYTFFLLCSVLSFLTLAI